MRFLPNLARLVFAGFVISLVVGVTAGFGTKYGMWDFKFGLLTLFPWCIYVGLGTVALGVVWGLLAFFTNSGGAARWGAIGLAGAVAVLVLPLYSIYVAKTSPPIHDITTDVVNPPQFKAVLPLRKGAMNSADYYGATKIAWNGETKTVAEWQRKFYTDIHTVQILTPPEKMFARAQAAASAMGWKIVAVVPDEGRIEATDTTLFFGFTDDIVIRVKPSGMGAKLDIRSESRVGISDVGKNASRIRSFIKELAKTKG